MNIFKKIILINCGALLLFSCANDETDETLIEDAVVETSIEKNETQYFLNGVVTSKDKIDELDASKDLIYLQNQKKYRFLIVKNTMRRIY